MGGKKSQHGTTGVRCSLGVTWSRTFPPRHSVFPSVAQGGWLGFSSLPVRTHGSTAGSSRDSRWRFRGSVPRLPPRAPPGELASLPGAGLSGTRAPLTLLRQLVHGSAQAPALPRLPARHGRSQRSPRRLCLTGEWRRRAEAEQLDGTRSADSGRRDERRVIDGGGKRRACFRP